MELTRLYAEIDRLSADELSVDPAVLGVEVCEIEQALNRLTAEKSRRLAAFDSAEGYLNDGQTSTKSWLRTQTTMSHGQAAAQTSVARVHGRLPLLFAAWHAGETTFDHVRQVEVNLRKLPDELWAEVDEKIMKKSRVKTVQEFGEWLRALAQSLGGEPKPKDETQHESRRFSLSVGFNGMTNVSGRLTPEVAEKFHAALSAASRPDATDEVRLRNQRTADALEHVLDAVLDSGRLYGEGGQKPHLNLGVDLGQIGENAQRDEEARHATVDWWALSDEERAERIRQGLGNADAATDPASGRPRYYWNGPASVNAARRLACDAVVLPMFTRNGTPIDVGRSYRLVSSPQRALIGGRDRHCQWPRCNVTGRWCVVHHVHHWRDGGTTDLWNLILLCHHHHRAAHDGRFTVVLHAPGKITVLRRTSIEQPYYDIRLKAPPPQPTLTDKLHAAAGYAAAEGHA